MTATLAGWGADALVSDAQLVISELATNACRYDGSVMQVDAWWDDQGVTVGIEDSDDGSDLPEMRSLVHHEAENGRGLAIVAALSDSWGVTATAVGKRVWARLGPP